MQSSLQVDMVVNGLKEKVDIYNAHGGITACYKQQLTNMLKVNSHLKQSFQ